MSGPSASNPSPASGSHRSTQSNADRVALSASGSVKRKRPQSCDTCRTRKIKCVLLQVQGLQPGADHRCVQCRAIDAKCTFDYVPKRPGPQSSFAKSARKEAADLHGKASDHRPSNPPKQSRDKPAQNRSASTSSASRSSDAIASTSSDVFALSPSQHQPLSTIDDVWYKTLSQHSFPTSSSASGTQTRASSWNGASFDSYLNQSMMVMTPHFSAIPSNATPQEPAHSFVGIHPQAASVASSTASSHAAPSPWPTSTDPYAQSQQFECQQHHLSLPFPSAYDVEPVAAPGDTQAASLEIPLPSFSRAVSPTPSYASSHSAAAPTNQNSPNLSQSRPIFAGKGKAKASTSVVASDKARIRSLDDVAPRKTFFSIVSLYFHYLWPLLPIVHRPFLSKDLLNRRDERDEDFLAFVLSLTSYTLIQCPRAVLPAGSEYKRLHRVCHLASQRLQPKTYDPPLLLHVQTLYCDHIYLGTIGKANAGNTVLGEAVRVAMILGLHDETKPDTFTASQPRHGGVNIVERELRKRMFWVLHGSSTTTAVLQDQPVFIHDVDVCLTLPLAVDEDTLTTPHQTQTASSVLCGFLAVSQLHQIMLEVVESYRRDRRYPSEDIRVLQGRSRYLADVGQRIRNVLDQMPPALRQPTFQHSPPVPIRKPGTAMPSLDPAMPSLRLDAADQDTLDHRLSNTSAWPWPADTFTQNLADSSFLTGSSPRPKQAERLSTSEASSSGSGSIFDGMQPSHHVLSPSAFLPPASGELSALDRVNLFRPTPPPTSTPILSPMCTMHANVVVTESLIHFMLAEYHALVSHRTRELLSRHPASAAAHTQNVDAGWQQAVANVLRVFNSMPLDALASNGQSLIDKIMYIVSSLLKRTSGSAPTMGYHYMSSLLLTLTKLSQTRMDDGQDHEESSDENRDDDRRSNSDGDDDDNEGGGDVNRSQDGEDRHFGQGNPPHSPKSGQDQNEKSDPDTRQRSRDHDSTLQDHAGSVPPSLCSSSVPSTAPSSVNSTAVSTPTSTTSCMVTGAPITLNVAHLAPPHSSPNPEGTISTAEPSFKIPRSIANTASSPHPLVCIR